MHSIPVYAKALLGGLIAGLGSAQQALDDSAVTLQEGVAIVLATLLGLGIVAAIPNRKPEGDAGYGAIELLVVVILVVLLIFLVLRLA